MVPSMMHVQRSEDYSGSLFSSMLDPGFKLRLSGLVVKTCSAESFYWLITNVFNENF